MSSPTNENRDAAFQPTRWSLVARAREKSTPAARDALSQLCKSYWYPLYAFVRRKGNSPEDSEDLIQEFMCRIIIEHDGFAAADRERGKLRTFLMTSLDNFLSNEWKKARAVKRGGGEQLISIDQERAEGRYHNEPVDTRTPADLFDHRGAVNVLELSLKRLRSEYRNRGKTEVFEVLKGFLSWNEGERTYADAGDALEMSEGAVKVAVHRLRGHYRKALRDEIADTLDDPTEADIQSEIGHLFNALRR